MKNLPKRDEEMSQKLMPAIQKAIKKIAEKEKYVAIFIVGILTCCSIYSKEMTLAKRYLKNSIK